jgi:hypothetical protein
MLSIPGSGDYILVTDYHGVGADYVHAQSTWQEQASRALAYVQLSGSPAIRNLKGLPGDDECQSPTFRLPDNQMQA